MEKKFRKLELIEVPMSELEQSALDEILAGYWCESYNLGGTCGKYFSTGKCTGPGTETPGDYCLRFVP